MKLLKRAWREEKLLSWTFGGLCVFVTAFLWSPSRDGLEAVYALAFFIPMLLVLPWRKPDSQQYGGVFTASALAYASWSALSSMWGDSPVFFLLQLLVLIVWLMGAAWVLQVRTLKLEKLLYWIFGIGSLIAVVNLFHFYSGHPFSARLEGLGISRTPTVAGQMYGLVVLIGVLLSWRTQCFNCAIWLLLASVPALAALGLSQSRGPMLSLVLTLIVACVWLRPMFRILLLQIGCALALLVALILILPVMDVLTMRGVSLRDQIWLHIWQVMKTDPLSFLWGVGMSETTKIATDFGVYHHAHNAWLDILYRTGVVGLGLALVHLGLLFWCARQQRYLAPLVLWLFYGCGCLFVNSRSLFWEIDAKWLLYWIPAALLAAQLARGVSPSVVPTKNQTVNLSLDRL
jgi:hypothetical protein